jgi:hypothetical protein
VVRLTEEASWDGGSSDPRCCGFSWHWIAAVTETRWGALLSLSLNDRGRLVYPVASSPRKEDVMSVPSFVGLGPMPSGSALVGPMEIKLVVPVLD